RCADLAGRRRRRGRARRGRDRARVARAQGRPRAAGGQPLAPDRPERGPPGADRAAAEVALPNRRGGSSVSLLVAQEHARELRARSDSELAEDLAQVILDRTRADEELRGDLGVGRALGGELRDPLLLLRELVACLV